MISPSQGDTNMIKKIILEIKKALGLVKKPEPPKKIRRKKSYSEMSEMELVQYHYEQAEKVYKNRGETVEQHTPEGIRRTAEKEKQAKRLLRFEFIPAMQARKNCRSYIQYTYKRFDRWKTIRDKVELERGGVCQICGADSKKMKFKHSTECHEVWEYDEFSKVQRLVALEALCVYCHKTKHLNQWTGNDEEFRFLLDTYALLNDIDEEAALKDYEFHIAEYDRLKNKKFTLDMSLLKTYGIEVDIFDCHSKEFNKFIFNTDDDTEQGTD